jgi:hypothetical protein
MIVAGGPIQWVKCLLKSGSKKEKRKKLAFCSYVGGWFGKKKTEEFFKIRSCQLGD